MALQRKFEKHKNISPWMGNVSSTFNQMETQ